MANVAKPGGRPGSGTTARTRAQLLDGALEAIRILDLATSRYRTAIAQNWQVTVTDSLIMSNLAMAGGRMTPRDLGRRLMISSGTLTSMLDRLENVGFVTRVPNPTDRRSLLVEMTELGQNSLFYRGTRLSDALDEALPAGTSSDVIDAMLAVAAAMDKVTDQLIASDE